MRPDTPEAINDAVVPGRPAWEKRTGAYSNEILAHE